MYSIPAGSSERADYVVYTASSRQELPYVVQLRAPPEPSSRLHTYACVPHLVSCSSRWSPKTVVRNRNERGSTATTRGATTGMTEVKRLTATRR